MLKLLKQHWFVLVVILFFVCAVVYYTYDKNKDNLPGKSVDGKKVVYSVDDTNVTADDMYTKLFDKYGDTTLLVDFKKAVLDAKVPTTDDMKTAAQSLVDQTVSYYTTYYGSSYGLDYLNSSAVSEGYDSFYDYVLYNKKNDKLNSDFVNADLDTYYTADFIAKYKPHMISYVLIKMDKPSAPTADESQRLADAQAAWKNGTYSYDNFADFAKTYSDDSSTASKGGVFGYLDTKSSASTTFVNAALALHAGEVSDWVYDSNYGYFLIACTSDSIDDFKTDDSFIASVLDNNQGLSGKIMWQAAQDLGVTFASDDIQASIKKKLGIDQPAASTTEGSN